MAQGTGTSSFVPLEDVVQDESDERAKPDDCSKHRRIARRRAIGRRS